ncbi:MAG: energy-coupling factor ABC transporter permease [Methermicoccaceae archaeon]
MHIPDGFLSAPVWVAMWLITLVVLGYSVKQVNGRLSDKHVPLMGVLAAFVFAAQMLNTPVAGGTSGHVLGGVMTAAMLGPWAATIVMSAVFVVQAIVFLDGGITTLGANIFNMGLIGTVFGYLIYKALRDRVHLPIPIAGGVAGWIAVVLASAATAIELGLSGTVPMGVALAAMVSVHMVIGLIEFGITAVVLGVVKARRPDLLEMKKI